MMRKVRVILVEVISGLFIFLFLYASLSKIQDFQKFQIELSKSPMLNAFSEFTAVTIPGIEIIIAIVLIVKKFQYLALYASFSIMVMFSVYIVLILKFSSYIPCSCGGILENMTWTQHLMFNIGFVALGAVAILIYP